MKSLSFPGATWLTVWPLSFGRRVVAATVSQNPSGELAGTASDHRESV